MNSLIPSKKVGLLLVLVSLPLALVIYYRDNPDNSEKTLLIQDNISENFQKIASIDSDGDNLKDWEEVLWGTDPKNSDSDGDGTPDGEETKSGRNPAVAGPDDLLEATSDNLIVSKEDSTTLSKDELFNQELFSRYLAKIQLGEEITSEELPDLIKSLIETHYGTEVREYLIEDIKIESDNTEEALRAYANNVGKVLNRPSGYENELVITLKAMEGETERIKELDGIIEHYGKVIEDILSIPVPNILATSHLSLIQSIANINEGIKRLRTIVDNPQNGMVGIANYKENINKTADTIEKIGKILLSRRVTFKNNEDGAIFTFSI